MESGTLATTEEWSTGRSIARSAVWHLAGQIMPLAIAVLTIPILIGGLGSDRFGVLSLAWVVIGYFALVDLGLGRAMTQALATRIGTGREEDVPAIFWSTFALMLLLGACAAAVGAALSPWLVDQALSIPDDLRRETRIAFLLLAVALPADMTMSALRGAMEARQRFDLTSMTRIATGLNTYLSPMAVMAFSDSLVAVVAVPQPQRTVYRTLERLAAPLASRVICVTMVARFAAPKDHRTLIEALRGVAGAELDLVGDGPDLDVARTFAHEVGMADRVHFLGQREDVAAILARSHVFVLCSDREGFPLSTLEAMRAGLPVVVSNVGGAPEAVVDGETGFLVPARDPAALRARLALLAAAPERRAAMGEAGRTRYEAEFTFAQMLARTGEVYGAVLAAARHPCRQGRPPLLRDDGAFDLIRPVAVSAKDTTGGT